MARTPESVPLWGETLCLDYANTVDWTAQGEHFDPARTDVLLTDDGLGRWARRLELLADDAEPPGGAELRRARTLRDAVHRVFASVSRGQPVAEEDLALLMSDYLEAVERGSLRAREHFYELAWPAREPQRIRHAVATDALAVLQDHDRLSRVRLCPGADCGWVFLDVSGRRRWCSMSTCGSRDKMRRLRERRSRNPA